MKIKNPTGIILNIVLIILIAFIIALPKINIAKSVPSDSFYPYIHGFAEDYYCYLSIINQGEKSLQYNEQYTTESVPSSQVHIFFLLLGKIKKLINISNISLYYGSNIVSLLLIFIFTYKIVGNYVTYSYRPLALFIIYFTGAFPPLIFNIFDKQVNTAPNSITAWANLTERLFQRPHHMFSTAMLLIAVYFILVFFKKGNFKNIILVAFVHFFGLLFFPIPGIIFITSLVLFVFLYLAKDILITIIKKKKLNNFLQVYRLQLSSLFILIPVSLCALLFHKIQLTDTSAVLNWENASFNPEEYPHTFWQFALAYAPLLPFVPFGIISAIKKPNFIRIFISLLFIVPFVLYLASVNNILPMNKLRFIMSAPYVFGGLLSIWGIEMIININKSPIKKIILAFFAISFIILNSFLNLKSYWYQELISKNNNYIPLLYKDVYEFLNTNTPKYSGILSQYLTGLHLPAFTHNKVFIGNITATVDIWSKLTVFERFANGLMSKEELSELAKKNNIKYIFWDIPYLFPPHYIDSVEKIKSFDDKKTRIDIYRFKTDNN